MALALRTPPLHCTTAVLPVLDLADSVNDLPQWNKLRIRDAGEFIFVRLANIDHLQIGLFGRYID